MVYDISMRIGIDFDDVVADSISFIVRLHNERYGTSLTRESMTSWRFEEVWGTTLEEAIRRTNEFFAEDQVTGVAPVAGSVEAIKKLKEQGHELYILTGRSENDVEETERWIKHHFPDVFKGVHYGNFFTLNKNHVFRKKLDTCRELGIEVLIEDNDKTALECAAAGIKVFLITTPWNKNFKTTPNIQRVHSWEEILKNYLESFLMFRALCFTGQ